MEIIQYPNPILRKKCQPVLEINQEVKEIIEKMKKIIKKHNGVGLAANQIGYSLRIIICYWENKFYIFINPKITKYSKKTIEMEEGCLSLKGIYGIVERPEKITIEALNIKGKKIKQKFFGIISRIIQHEVDHLEGILFIDRTKNIYSINNQNLEKSL